MSKKFSLCVLVLLASYNLYAQEDYADWYAVGSVNYTNTANV